MLFALSLPCFRLFLCFFLLAESFSFFSTTLIAKLAVELKRTWGLLGSLLPLSPLHIHVVLNCFRRDSKVSLFLKLIEADQTHPEVVLTTFLNRVSLALRMLVLRTSFVLAFE